MKRLALIIVALVLLLSTKGYAAEKSVAVFVALADNKNQGIVPVSAALGDCEDPEKNLYWGSGEGLKTTFDRSKEWKLTAKVDSAEGDMLRQRTYQHIESTTTLHASAYKGAAIKRCIEDFERAVSGGKHDVVVFVGHNGLMDFVLPVPKKVEGQTKTPDVIVLCCKSGEYFKPRLQSAGGRPVVLTTQLMYPGSFLVHAAVDEWIKGSDRAKIRAACGEAYAKNQKISVKAATGLFAELR